MIRNIHGFKVLFPVFPLIVFLFILTFSSSFAETKESVMKDKPLLITGKNFGQIEVGDPLPGLSFIRIPCSLPESAFFTLWQTALI